MKCKCPLCNGSGKIDMVLKPNPSLNKQAAIRLRNKGFTIRQIMTALGYKHPGSISNLLRGIDKTTLK